jgi:hypothetical protein
MFFKGLNYPNRSYASPNKTKTKKKPLSRVLFNPFGIKGLSSSLQ